MITLSKVMLCSDFNKKERSFATLFFVKSGKGSKLASCALSARAYTFGIDVTGIVSSKFWGKDEDEKLAEIKAYFDDVNFEEEGLRCYDITVLDVTDGKYKAVNFNENALETFHRAFIGSRDECLSDLKRQFEKNKNDWDLVDA